MNQTYGTVERFSGSSGRIGWSSGLLPSGLAVGDTDSLTPMCKDKEAVEGNTVLPISPLTPADVYSSAPWGRNVPQLGEGHKLTVELPDSDFVLVRQVVLQRIPHWTLVVGSHDRLYGRDVGQADGMAKLVDGYSKQVHPMGVWK